VVVPIDEAGQKGRSVQLDDLGLRPDGEDPTGADGHRLGRRLRFLDRHDGTAAEDLLGPPVALRLSRALQAETACREERSDGAAIDQFTA
jgi:hypothetical protein